MPAIIIRAFAVWGAILLLAMANGIFREAVLMSAFGVTISLPVSGLLLSALILITAWLALPWLQIRRNTQALSIGLGWLLLTLLFEFSFGLWQGQSWQLMFEAYTFRDGNIWPLVLLVTAAAPGLALRLRTRNDDTRGSA